MARRNYSAELLTAQKNGQKIVCSMEPYAGVPMVYSPNRLRDPRPWRFEENAGAQYHGMFRYSGRECHAVHPLTGQYFSYTVTGESGADDLTFRVKITHIDPDTATAQVRADHWRKSVEIGTDRLFDAEMLNALSTAERFFYDHAGTGYNPATEIPFIGRVSTARKLARAETERKNAGAWVDWETDDLPFNDDVHGPDEYGYIAVLRQYDPELGRSVILSAQGSIDAESGDPYRRVVEAELFSEYV